jgi:hypothetical protein
MTQLLTISDVKKILQEENMDYKVDSYEYGFVLHTKNKENIEVIYYFNQEGRYLYPTKESLMALGQKIG